MSENSERYRSFALIFLVLRAPQLPNSALCRGRGGEASLATWRTEAFDVSRWKLI